MMNTLFSRLRSAGLIVSAAVLAPIAAFAQDATAAAPADNSSGFIGLLVVWLLAIGGAGALFAMLYSDRTAQASRSTRR